MKQFRRMAAALCAVFLLCGFVIPAYAYADGGEGTAEALTAGLHGEMVSVEVTGPLGAPVVCRYGVAGSLAIVEMAGAAGLPQVPAEKRDPMATTTFGVGEVIRDAIARGCRRFVIGLGGSATNDGGAGMLQALGFDLLDENGAPIPRGAAGLARLRTIAAGRVLPALRGCTFRAACDVENPLCGPLGCSAVFGPQKGARAADVPKMDGWLRGFAALAKTVFPESDADFPGSGAAGPLFSCGVPSSRHTSAPAAANARQSHPGCDLHSSRMTLPPQEKQPFFAVRFHADGQHPVPCGLDGTPQGVLRQFLFRQDLRLPFYVGGSDFFDPQRPAHRLVDMRFAHGTGHPFDGDGILQHGSSPFPVVSNC